MKINLPKLYSQLDPQYASTPIGNSNIKAIGCLTADAAMVSSYFGHPENPTSLAQKVKYSGNLWVWSELTRLYPDIKYVRPVHSTDIFDPLTDAQMNEIRGAINQGIPVFIKIITPTIPEHWLVGVDYNGDDILVADPLTLPAKVHPITDFGISPKKVIYAYGWYQGNLPSSDALAECLRQHAILVKQVDDLKKVNGELQTKLNNFQTEMTNKLAEKDRQCQAKIQDFKNRVISLVNSLS